MSMTPEERASDLTKWVAADLRPRQWAAIRDSIVEALTEEREACAHAAQSAVRSFRGDTADLESVAAHIAESIRARGTSG